MTNLQQAERQAKSIRNLTILLALSFLFLASTATYFFVEGQNQSNSIEALNVNQSACQDFPNGQACKEGHANSVALTTYAEACFILAQGGKRCGPRPLPEAKVFRRSLVNSAGDSTGQPQTSGDDSPQGRIDSGDPRPDTPSDPGGEPTPRPPGNAPVAPSVPDRPVAPSVQPDPVLKSPLPQLGLCVNALGIEVVC